MEKSSEYCKVCVTGASGYIGSYLIKKLLNKGVYYVHATLRNLGDASKVNPLKSLPGAETRLQLFEADLNNSQQFEAAIKDCEFVFHLATPYTRADEQSQDIIEAAVAGVKSIVTSCIRSGTVRRLIYTASVTAASALKDDGTGLKDFVDENCWTPLHHPLVISSPHKDYIVTKTKSEKAALEYTNEGNFEVVSLVLGLVGGETVLSHASASTEVNVSQLTGSQPHYQSLRLLEELLGKIPILHIEDACEAHIFCMEKDSIHGRFLCASNYVSSAEIAEYLQQNYPEFQVKQVYMDIPKRTIRFASTKLIDQGFKYGYDMKMILDDSVKCVRRFGGLF